MKRSLELKSKGKKCFSCFHFHDLKSVSLNSKKSKQKKVFIEF
jgi:hypothetical protein